VRRGRWDRPAPHRRPTASDGGPSATRRCPTRAPPAPGRQRLTPAGARPVPARPVPARPAATCANVTRMSTAAARRPDSAVPGSPMVQRTSEQARGRARRGRRNRTWVGIRPHPAGTSPTEPDVLAVLLTQLSSDQVARANRSPGTPRSPRVAIRREVAMGDLSVDRGPPNLPGVAADDCCHVSRPRRRARGLRVETGCHELECGAVRAAGAGR
jgi:hypothetical protein